MFDVYLCHSAGDRVVAEAIARRLGRFDGIRVIRDECAPGTIGSAWEGGTASSAIVLVLSNESVPAKLSRDAWSGLLDEIDDAPPVACVVVDSCGFPGLLKRKAACFEWSGASPDALRAVERWLVGARGRSEIAALPRFEGREKELDVLWSQLVDGKDTLLLSGPPGSGKSWIAQQFAVLAHAQFREVVWIACGTRSGESLEREIRESVQGRRVLLILDDLRFPMSVYEPHASVLITSREDLPELDGVEISPLRKASAPVVAPQSDLWMAAAVCCPARVTLELAAAAAGLDLWAARTEMGELVSSGLVDPFDSAGTIFRMPFASRELALDQGAFDAFGARHSVALAESPSLRPGDYLHEVYHLLGEWPYAARPVWRAAVWLREQRRTREAASLLRRLRDLAEEHESEEWVARCDEEVGWLENAGANRHSEAREAEQLSLDLLC